MSLSPIPAATRRSLYWLALGTFAIGTEAFMIAPLLPAIARDLRVSLANVGGLVAVFAIAYAISSPVLTAITGAANRRRLLIGTLAAFAAGNLVAAGSNGYWGLFAARVMLALTAGLYVPSANAVAAALVTPERRGSALAIVNSGFTIAVALGTPLGALLGHAAGWRSTFIGIAALATAVTLALVLALPRGFGTGIVPASLAQRLGVARQPALVGALFITTLWALGAYTMYTYVAAYMDSTLGIRDTSLSLMLFLLGTSAAVGIYLSGALTDRVGHHRVLVPGLAFLSIAFASLSASSHFLNQGHALFPVLLAVVAWGATAWGFLPAQQARLVSIAGVSLAPIVLSLNASFMYLGFFGGAVIGGLVLSHAGAGDLGWASALPELAALLLIMVSRPKNHLRVVTARCEACL